MTDEIIADTVATEVTPTPAPETVTQPPPQNDFAIPDAYKDKPWASKVKTSDDLWKQLENTNSLIGKKSVAPDWDNATPKEIEDYYTQLRPTDKAAYQFDESLSPEQKTAYADMLHKHGISAKQGNDLIKDYMAQEQAVVAKMYDKDAFLAELKTSFGNDYEKTAGDVAKTLAANLNDNDKALLEKVPNQFLGVIYRVAANLNKAYGVTEGASAANPPANLGVVDVEKRANEIRDELMAMSRRNHTAEERQAKTNELANLYKKG